MVDVKIEAGKIVVDATGDDECGLKNTITEQGFRIEDIDGSYVSLEEDGIYSKRGNGSVHGIVFEKEGVSIDKFLVPHILYGKATANSATNTNVTFSKAFNKPPVVIACYSTTEGNTSGDFGSLKVHSIKNTGFSVTIGGSVNATVRNISYIAIG